MPEEVLDFLNRHNEFVFHGAKTQDDFKSVWRRVFDPDFAPRGKLESVSSGNACLWWSPPIADTYLDRINSLSKRAVDLVGPICSGSNIDTSCEPRITWIGMARDFVRKVEWPGSSEQVLLEPIGDDEFAERSKEREDCPTPEQLCTAVEVAAGDYFRDFIRSLGTHVAWRTVVAMQTAGRNVPRVLCENLGNPADYSAKAIVFKLAEMERLAARCLRAGIDKCRCRAAGQGRRESG